MDRILILVLVSDPLGTAKKDPVLTRIQGTDGDDAVSKKLVAFSSITATLREASSGIKIWESSGQAGVGRGQPGFPFLAPEI